MRFPRLAPWLVALALIGAACGSNDDDAGTAEPDDTADAPGQPAPDDEVAERQHVEGLTGLVDDDGVLSKDAALVLFASTIAPLPGVQPDDTLETGADDPSLAARAVIEHWEDLTAEQQDVVESIVFGPDRAALDEVTILPGEVTEEGAPPATPGGDEESRGPAIHLTGAGDPVDRSVLVRAMIGEIQVRLGRPLDIPVNVVEITTGEASELFAGTHAIAAAAAVPGPDGGIESCLVRFNPLAPTPLDPAAADERTRSAVAHEVFHCFQFDLLGDRALLATLPLWVKEGSAAWVGEEIARGSNLSRGWWFHWLTNPERGLATRSYDAIGLYSLVDAVGGDVWGRLPAVHTGDARLPTLLGGDTDAVLARWGSSVAREPGWGDEWDTIGPGVTDEAATIAPVPVRVDAEPVTVRNAIRADNSAHVISFGAEGDILSVSVTGLTGRLHLADDTTVVLTGAEQADFCLAEGGCECPDGSTPVAGAQDAGEGTATMGLASLTSGGSVTIELRSLDEACEDPPAPTSDGCFVGSWTSGDWSVPVGTSTGGSGIALTLTDGGTGTVDFGGMAPVSLTPDTGPGAPPVDTTIRYSGSGAVTWSSDGAEVAITYADAAAFTYQLQATFNGSPILDESGPFTELAAGAPMSGGVPFRCTDDGWVLTMPVPGGTGALELPFGR